MPKTFQKPEPVFKHKPDSAYEEGHKRMLAAFSKARFSFSPDSYHERRKAILEQININLQKEFGPDNVTETLISIQRVLLPKPNMFERDGILDSNHKVHSAITYKVLVEVEDPEVKKLGYRRLLNPEELGAGSVTFSIGRYPRPIVEATKFDKQGNVLDARIVRYDHTYFLADKPDSIKSLLKRYNCEAPVKPYTVAIANTTGSNVYSGVYQAIDQDEFATADISAIIGGNKIGLSASAYKQWDIRKYRYQSTVRQIIR